MKRHIIYIPGLGDGYDIFRKAALLLWWRPSVAVTLLPMRWLDPDETYEQKVVRIGEAIGKYDDRVVTLVGESAGGAVAIGCLRRYRTQVTQVVTVCGMNQGAGIVNPALYRKNRAFRDAMLVSDETLPTLTTDDKADILTVYSSRDGVIGKKDTLIEGVSSIDIKIPLHMLAIGYVLFVRYDLVIGNKGS